MKIENNTKHLTFEVIENGSITIVKSVGTRIKFSIHFNLDGQTYYDSITFSDNVWIRDLLIAKDEVMGEIMTGRKYICDFAFDCIHEILYLT